MNASNAVTEPGASAASRKPALHAAKLRALAASTLEGQAAGTALAQLAGTEVGASALAQLPDGRTAAVYLAEQHEPAGSGLGAALATWHGFAADENLAELHLFAPTSADTISRRAAHFDVPITVWRVDGANTELAQPAPKPTEPAPPRVPELVAQLAHPNVTVTVEHGLITAEVNGLEVARISPGPSPADASADAPQAEPPSDDLTPVAPQAEQPATERTAEGHEAAEHHVAVGVGEVDQQAFAVVHAAEPAPAALARVAQLVHQHRSPGAEPHPLNRLAAARWLRAVVCRQPELVGAAKLANASPPVARTGVKSTEPAVAYGVSAEGNRLVVVVAVGIDLELVPFAADARAFLDADAELAVLVPERDAHRLTEWAAAQLHRPATVRTVSDSWRNLPT